MLPFLISPRPLFLRLLTIALVFLLLGCSLPQVSAEERIFLDLSLDFLDEYQLPKAAFAETPVRGLSALSYDRQRDRFYMLSDDRSDRAPARFYTLKLVLDTGHSPVKIDKVEIEKVTFLRGEDGNFYARGAIDPEGLALSPRNSVFISSEGVAHDGIPPFVDEFDLETGRWRGKLPIPMRFIPQPLGDEPAQGVQDNLGFEALTLNPGGYSPAWLEPFRLFTATEYALAQDVDTTVADRPIYSRFLHYLVGEQLPTLISEHLYPIDPPPLAATNGLTELLVLDQGGHFLSLERSFGLAGSGARIFQIATGGATDTSLISSLKGDLSGIVPISKRLLLDLHELNIPLDNLEGMTLGPQLLDGTRSLILVSDDNFNDDQITQLLLFRLREE